MVKKVAESQGVKLSVAMVTGDDMMQEVYNSISDKHTHTHLNNNIILQLEKVRESEFARDLDTGKVLPKSVLSMNAYLG